MRLRLTTLDQCRLMLNAASWIVPPKARADWLREWEAELACAWQISSEKLSLPRSIGLRRRCCGAFIDAAWYRLNREDRQRVREQWPRTPAFVLFTLLSVLMLLITGSGYLPRMRSLLIAPPYAHPQRMATVSRAGLINSAEWVVPYSWVKIWRRPGRSVEGIAAYSARAQESSLAVGGRRRSVQSVAVEPGLLQLFGVKPLLGRTVPEGNGCNNCLLLSYQSWQRNFAGDLNIGREDAMIDGRPAHILGVLPERFWFPSDDVAVLRVADENFFSPDKPVGVVARLRPDVTERYAEWELQRSVANAAGEAFSGSTIQVWPLQERVRQPLISYGFALLISLLLTIAMLSSGRVNLFPQRRGAAVAFRWWSYFATKTSLLLLILLAAVVEFTPEPYIFPSSRATMILESGSLWIFSTGCMLVLWWSLMDQQSRCRACLHKLVLPAQIGPSGCMLLSWAGTELVCAQGHGLLHVTETDVSWLDPSQWTQLDESWEPLFAESN